MTVFLAGAFCAQGSVIYNWSYADVDQGGNHLISGTLELDESCLTSCTNIAATSVVLTSAPFGPIGIDFTSQVFGQFGNNFNAVNGAVTYANFFAALDLGGPDNASLILCIDCPFGYQSLEAGGLQATDGFGPGDGNSIEFSIVQPIPLPGAFPVLFSALVGLGIFGRRRNGTRRY